MTDPFIRPAASYVRQYDLYAAYVRDTALYLSKLTGQPLEQARAFVLQQTRPDGPMAFKQPRVAFLERNSHGDRVKKTGLLTDYLSNVNHHRQILSPSMIAYTSIQKTRSILGQYVDENLQLRKDYKKRMFQAKIEKDEVKANIFNSLQTSQKIKNNSLSGAHVSKSTVLLNKTAHSTLTSTCRVGTSYGNANNERLLYGNRHYWSPDVAKANLASILNHTDLERLERMMRRHRLVSPTHEQTMAMIRRSTDPYWRNSAHLTLLDQFVRQCSAVERAALCFTGDLYHLALVNPDPVRTLITRLITRPNQPLDPEQAQSAIQQLNEGQHTLMSMLCSDLLTGTTEKTLQQSDPCRYGILGAQAKSMLQTIEDYTDLIQTLLVTDNLPASIYHLPNIVRRGVITSDTDSTIFSVGDWTQWYVGKRISNPLSTSVAAVMIYFSSQSIRHVLAKTCGNLGVDPSHMFDLEMKNEFYYPTFATTARAKHYYAYIGAQEGHLYEKYKTEIKGVALRSSNVPKEIIEGAKSMMHEIMDQIIAGQSVSMRKLLTRTARMERKIEQRVKAGDPSLLNAVMIKGMKAYKDPASSNYRHYELWEEVFAPTYGHAPPPPYLGIKLSLTTDNASKFTSWIESIENKALANRLSQWVSQRNTRYISTILLPEPITSVSGIPKELIQAMDIRSLIAMLMESWYLVLESIGIYIKNPANTRLALDQLPKE